MKKLFIAMLALSAMLMTACKPGEEPSKKETKKATVHCAISGDVVKYFDVEIKCFIDDKTVDVSNMFTTLEKVTDEAILQRAHEIKDDLFEYTGELPLEFDAAVSTKKVKAVATLHRNKTKITEDECTLAYTLFLRTDAGILSTSDSFSLIRLIGFESEEAAEKSLMLYDGDNFELEWTLTRQ